MENLSKEYLKKWKEELRGELKHLDEKHNSLEEEILTFEAKINVLNAVIKKQTSSSESDIENYKKEYDLPTLEKKLENLKGEIETLKEIRSLKKAYHGSTIEQIDSIIGNS